MAGKRIEVDFDRLKKAVESRNFTILTAGEEIGRCSTCLYGAKKNGYLSRPVIEDLKAIGITYDMIKPVTDEKPEAKPEAETRFTTMDEQMLKTLIGAQAQANNNMISIFKELQEIKELLVAILG